MRINPYINLPSFKGAALAYPNSYLEINGYSTSLLHSPVGEDYLGANIEGFETKDTLLGKVLATNISKGSKKAELNTEDGPKIVRFNPENAIRNSTLAEKRICAQPPLRIIGKGTAKGKVVFYPDDEALRKSVKHKSIREPIIAVVDSPGATGSIYGYEYSNHPLVKAIIFANRDEGSLCHSIAQVRNSTEVAAMVYDKKVINKLKKLEGKTIELNINHKGINFKKISPDEVENKIKEKRIVKIRPMSSEARILKPGELTRDNAGPKAYNLQRLLDMQEEGKLKNVKIPPFFVVPVGIFDSFLKAYPENAKPFKEYVKQLEDNLTYEEASKVCHNTGNYIYNMLSPNRIENMPAAAQEHYKAVAEQLDKDIKEIIDSPEDYLIVRSAFNGEDTPNYSAAGIYRSCNYAQANVNDVMNGLIDVWRSQYGMSAYLSRKENGIPEDAIKPCAIIQKEMIPDYKFTVYTEDLVDPDSLFIEMSSTTKNHEYVDLTADPNIIKYNKKTGKLTFIAKERFNEPVITDLKGKVVIASPQKSELADNYEEWEPTLKELAQSCLEISDEFDAPQDIEGGVNVEEGKHQIYLWQTRNIVKAC